jgi:membrane protease YdiL (CAAX protease family)
VVGEQGGATVKRIEIRSADSSTLMRIAPGVPYVAVGIGLYLMSSGWAAILLYHAGMVAVLTASKSWAALRTSNSRKCRLTLSVIVMGSALVGPVLYGLWSAMQAVSDLSELLSELHLVGFWWLLFAIYYFTVNPFLEESFWRGYLGNGSSRLVLNDGFFAGYHLLVLVKLVRLPWVVAGFAGLVGAGWLWRQVARECEGLLVPVLSHTIADASLIAAAFLIAA